MAKVSHREIDQAFNDGNDVLQHADASTIERPNLGTKRVSVDMVEGMIERLDLHAARLGVPRQALIKVWLGERLDRENETFRRLGA